MTRHSFSIIDAPWWDDAPVVLVGSGPSLRGFDMSRLKGMGHVVAIKQTIWDLPFAECCFGLDMPWIRRLHDKLAELTIPVFLALPDHPPIDTPVLHNAVYLKRSRFEGLSLDPSLIQTGGNSGFGAFNLATLKRAKEIFLFGFDYTEGAGGHYNPDLYKWYKPGHNAHLWENWGSNYAGCMGQLKTLGVQVYNASMISTVECFPKVTLDDAVEHLDWLRSERDNLVCGLPSDYQETPTALR